MADNEWAGICRILAHAMDAAMFVLLIATLRITRRPDGR